MLKKEFRATIQQLVRCARVGINKASKAPALNKCQQRSGNIKNGKRTVAKKTKFNIKIDRSRDINITDFGKVVLKDRYLLEGEDYQYLFARGS
jgi:ribonucleotide reductase alpha subunit